SLWHFPLIISGVYLAQMPMGPQLVLLVISIMAMTFPISWLRLKSGSLWAAVLMHASHNLYIQRFFDPLTTETGALSKYLIGESGIVMSIVFVVVAIIFWRLRSKLSAA
ncbi:type II CAAX prenyl endopeptidase Rce1 family protein, partial [Candidatus Margulisiibacteriota bacterium]